MPAQSVLETLLLQPGAYVRSRGRESLDSFRTATGPAEAAPVAVPANVGVSQPRDPAAGTGPVEGIIQPLQPPTSQASSPLRPSANPSAIASLAAPLPVASINTMANYLRQGFFSWFGGSSPRSFNLGTTGTGAQIQSRTLIFSYYGFTNISGAGTDSDGVAANRRPIIDRVLQDIGRTYSITFRHYSTGLGDTVGDIDLYFKDNDSGAYSNSQLFGSGNTSYYANHKYIDYSWVNVATSWYGSSTAENDYVYQTYYHEIQHALGLGHAGAYNGTVNFITDTTAASTNNNVFLNDSWEMTMMSYINQQTNTYVPGSVRNFLTSGMAADIEALRFYYGGSTFTGNTIYGVGTNITSAESYMFNKLSTFASTNAFCIIDDGGIDTLNFSNFSANQKIDLTIASNTSTANYGNVASDIGGKIRNMTISPYAVIENAVGGTGADTIIGNTANNNLNGHLGADTITTGGGVDTVSFNFGNGTVSSGSRAAALDKIADLSWGVDKIDLLAYNANPYVGTNLAAPVAFSRAANTAATTVSAVGTYLFSGLAANSARMCVSTGLSNRVFLAVNNSVAGYSNDDLLIELGGIPAASLPAVGSIAVSTLFV